VGDLARLHDLFSNWHTLAISLGSKRSFGPALAPPSRDVERSVSITPLGRNSVQLGVGRWKRWRTINNGMGNVNPLRLELSGQ